MDLYSPPDQQKKKPQDPALAQALGSGTSEAAYKSDFSSAVAPQKSISTQAPMNGNGSIPEPSKETASGQIASAGGPNLYAPPQAPPLQQAPAQAPQQALAPQGNNIFGGGQAPPLTAAPPTSLGPQIFNPTTGTAGHVPQPERVQAPPLQSAPTTHTLGNPNAPPPVTNQLPPGGAPAAGGIDPFAASGGGTNVNGNWIPNSNPAEIARQRALAGQSGSTTGSAPTGAPGAPSFQFGAAPGAPTGTTYTPGQLPGSTQSAYSASQFSGSTPEAYKETQFSQFSGPNQQQTDDSQTALINRILANPESMSPQMVAQLKGVQQDSATSMAKQLQDQLGENVASRGLSSGGGFANSNARRIGENSISQILGANRDIDIQKAQTDRSDQLNALGAASDVMSGQMNRASQGYQNTLAGQSAQAGEGKFTTQSNLDRNSQDLQRQGMQADENYRGWGSQKSLDDAAFQRAMGQEGLNQAGADSKFRQYGQDSQNYFGMRDAGRADQNLALQGELGRGGLANDSKRIAQNDRQFDLSHILARQQFGENQRQFNGSMGLSYNQLDQQGQLEQLRQMLGLF